MVPSFHLSCLFCSKLWEKSTRVNFRENFRENTKTNIFFSTYVRRRGYPQPICDHLFNDDISVYSPPRLFSVGYRPPVGEKWESKLCFHVSFGMNSYQQFLPVQCIAVLCSLILYTLRTHWLHSGNFTSKSNIFSGHSNWWKYSTTRRRNKSC